MKKKGDDDLTEILLKMAFNATVNNISVRLWMSVLLLLTAIFNNISVRLWMSVLLLFNAIFNNISVRL
jgi:hypothetical protein